ncbi:hypothetical protein QT970_26665 [Microcoleus sp. herbarium8]|uniref:hypothetical protein n=1 Tax=Microcoleus sp. herbarium8 TaxID=3055436 RepID=UPI002FD2DC9F
MVNFYKKLESQPALLFLNQIEVAQEKSGTSTSILKKVSQSIADLNFNLSLPLVCLTDEEDQYHLLTGLPIYEATKEANLIRLWVFVIAAKQPEAEKAIEQALLQSKLNERVVEPQDVTDFLDFINNPKSDLTSIPGVKDGYAKLIRDKRVYSSLEDMQKKLGAKRGLNWLRAYKQSKS